MTVRVIQEGKQLLAFVAKQGDTSGQLSLPAGSARVEFDNSSAWLRGKEVHYTLTHVAAVDEARAVELAGLRARLASALASARGADAHTGTQRAQRAQLLARAAALSTGIHHSGLASAEAHSEVETLTGQVQALEQQMGA